jgi:DNA-binding PadR family transcriptional regulator
MPVPDLTHLQFFVLTSLLDGEQTGRHLREKLAEEGVRRSGPAFYQFMARLEDNRLVKGRYEQKVVEGQIIKERRYELTAAGVRALEQVRKFYAEHVRQGARGRLANA